MNKYAPTAERFIMASKDIETKNEEYQCQNYGRCNCPKDHCQYGFKT